MGEMEEEIVGQVVLMNIINMMTKMLFLKRMYRSFLKLKDLIEIVVINGIEESHHLETVTSKEIWVEMLEENKLHRGTLHKDHHIIFNMVNYNEKMNNLWLQGPTHMVTMVKRNIDMLHQLLQVPMVLVPLVGFEDPNAHKYQIHYGGHMTSGNTDEDEDNDVIPGDSAPTLAPEVETVEEAPSVAKTVAVGNGQGLVISNTGSSVVTTGSGAFKPNNVLHVEAISSKLPVSEPIYKR
ncbi:hypothetical protein CKAN_02079600 [Cinnamomum micranthum f. kanehirae]|uniref:Uncharacterized protein n=1 Tax=Cinnamomum micranthum f. kanehirae TaxID=337451 RepID=A0A3S3N3J6_9MAGN|nr:hypothetical protein CKAN_02079600 [Cinnamomum micranthum f. kanehirae]